MSVLQHFEEYQKARVKFVGAVAEAAADAGAEAEADGRADAETVDATAVTVEGLRWSAGGRERAAALNGR
jgi:hypothetical protein